MARRYYYRQEQRRGSGWTAVLVIVLFALILGAVYAIVGGIKHEYNPLNWFKSATVEAAKPDDNTSDNSTEGGVIDVVQAEGMTLNAAPIARENFAMLGISNDVKEAFDISVAVEPLNSSYTIQFETVWKNGSSAWATGKNVTDYAYISNESYDNGDLEDGVIKNELCICQAFSEQILLKATIVGHEDIYATATLDYVCEWVGADIKYSVVSSLTGNFYIEKYEDEDFEQGTIIPDYWGNITVQFEIWDHYVSNMAELGYTMSQSVEYTESLSELGTDTACIETVLKDACDYKNLSAEKKETFFNDLSIAMLDGCTAEACSGDTILHYKLYLNRIYNGVDYGRVEINSGALELSDWSGFVIKPTSVTFGQRSYIAFDGNDVDVTFNVVPANATPEVHFGLEWANPDSEWARGKSAFNYYDWDNGYPDPEDFYDNYLYCCNDEGFSEQIILTMRDHDTGELYDTATLDYLLSAADFDVYSDVYFNDELKYDISGNTFLGNYTVLPDNVDDNNFFDVTYSLKNNATNNSIVEFMTARGYDCTGDYIENFGLIHFGYNGHFSSFREGWVSFCLHRIFKKTGVSNEQLASDLLEARFGEGELPSNGILLYLECNIDMNRIYNGVNYGSVEVQNGYEITVWTAGMSILPRSLSFSESSIIAGKV